MFAEIPHQSEQAEPIDTNQDDDFGVAADAFEIPQWFGMPSQDVDKTDGISSETGGSLRSELFNKSQQTASRFYTRVNRETLSRGTVLSAGILGMIGQMAISCGPLCLHALSGAGSAMSGFGAVGGGGFGGDWGVSSGVQGVENGVSGAALNVPQILSQLHSSGQIDTETWQSIIDILGLSFGLSFGFNVLDIMIGAVLPSGKAA